MNEYKHYKGLYGNNLNIACVDDREFYKLLIEELGIKKCLIGQKGNMYPYILARGYAPDDTVWIKNSA